MARKLVDKTTKSTRILKKMKAKIVVEKFFEFIDIKKLLWYFNILLLDSIRRNGYKRIFLFYLQ